MRQTNQSISLSNSINVRPEFFKFPYCLLGFCNADDI